MVQENQKIDFSVNSKNLYREEAYTDIKLANIKQLVPIHEDGTVDDTRQEIYIAQTQLMTSQGPVPLQATLNASTLKEAIDAFPAAMEDAMKEMFERIRQIQEAQQKAQKGKESRIYMPGR